MGEYLDQVPENLHSHLKAIAKSSKLGEGEEALEKIAQGWLEKEKIFGEETGKQDMEEMDSLAQDDERGALALTYSGSLVNIGPLTDGVRKVVYTSIGMRTDAPDKAENDESKLGGDIAVDDVIKFETGPVKSTSQIFKIAVCKADLSAEDQEEALTQAMTVVEDLMLDVNKTVMTDE